MSNLSLPARPTSLSINALLISLGSSACPPFTSRLLHALDQGILLLAETVYKIDDETPSIQTTPFGSRNDPLPRIVNVLLLLKPNLLEIMIRGQLHLTFQPGRRAYDLPADHRIEVGPANKPNHQERPVIYAMLHCSAAGKTLTPAQFEEILRVMDMYISDQNTTADWKAADEEASRIDQTSPSRIAGLQSCRGWTGRTSGAMADKWKKKVHPRRYAHSDRTKKTIGKCIKGLNLRLRRIPATKKNKPVDFALTYIGWSRNEQARKAQHYGHTDLSSSLK